MPSSSVPHSRAAAKPAGHARPTRASAARARGRRCASPPRVDLALRLRLPLLEQVARDASFTHGALYHLFDGKDDLALASVDGVAAT
jgi:hypothetical protein